MLIVTRYLLGWNEPLSETIYLTKLWSYKRESELFVLSVLVVQRTKSG